MLSPFGTDTDVISDEAGIAAFTATDTFCTFTVVASVAAGIGVMLGMGGEVGPVTS